LIYCLAFKLLNDIGIWKLEKVRRKKEKSLWVERPRELKPMVVAGSG
jgi:hypothetical protein